MWYAVQVRTGEEEKTRFLCNKMISGEVLKECFVLYYEKAKKYQGNWHKMIELLFPGYIFMVSEMKDDLRIKVKDVPGFIKILGDGNEIIPLNEQEIEFLLKLGDKNHLVKLSRGYIEQDSVVITEGPMKNFVGIIKKIDRHKRMGIVELDLFDRKTEICVGLEIIDRK